MKDWSSHFEETFGDIIKSKQVLSAVVPDLKEFPHGLQPQLSHALKQKGIKSLYSHQAEAYQSITGQENTVIVSQTASGKTLSFLLPILQDYMTAEKPFSVLLLYPTKALSRDQEGGLGELLDVAGVGRKLGTFDGDTPREERERLVKHADFINTNPDMLHGGILPNHNRRWKSFLSRLKYIVVDEMHTYRGSFGSHLANVFRRLQRVAAVHNSVPQWILCSATIANPEEHGVNLIGQPVRVVEKDGSARPKRNLYLLNPSMRKNHQGNWVRKSASSAVIPLLADAVKFKKRTICFCRGRQEVERIYKAVVERDPGLKHRVKPYRGGLLPNERRQLEKDFFSGKTSVIISTNALEVGIDIGDLDLCVLNGHPGSVASFWQQAGRVGRKGNQAHIVFIAKNTPVDQYFIHHPAFLTSRPVERAWIHRDNPYIFLQHLPCAAHEFPLSTEETVFDTGLLEEGVQLLRREETLLPYGDRWRYALRDYPAKGVNLRGMTDYNIVIYCGEEVIGEMDPIGARGSLYKDAIYQHLGNKYLSLNLDLEQKLCRVERVDVDYFTEASWERRVEMTESFDAKNVGEHQVLCGAIHSNHQPKLYKKIRERSQENVGFGPITLAPFEYDSSGFCIRFSKSWQSSMKQADPRFVGSAIYGLGSLLKKVAPHFCMGDWGDLETDVALSEAGDEWKSSLYLFDSVDGGIGYGEKVYEELPQVLAMCLEIIQECECEQGCPACVPPVPAGAEGEEFADWLQESNVSVASTESLLKHLLYGELVIPKIEASYREPLPTQSLPPIDEKKQIQKQKLQRASRLMQRKRERTH